MTFSVYKYKLSSFKCRLDLPVGAEVLHVGLQGNDFMIWAKVDTSVTETEPRLFYLKGTGHDMDDLLTTYHGTVYQGQYVWHLFEYPSPEDIEKIREERETPHPHDRDEVDQVERDVTMKLFAEQLKDQVGDNHFCLLMFKKDELNICDYISDVNREDIVAVLRATATHIEETL